MGILKSLHLESHAGLESEMHDVDFIKAGHGVCTFLETAGFKKTYQKDFSKRTNYIFKNDDSKKKQIIYMDLTQKNDHLYYTIHCDYQKRGFHFGHNYNDEFMAKLSSYLKQSLFANITNFF